MGAHVVPDLGPHGEEGALALVITRAVGVRLPEVAGGDRPVYGAHDLAERDLVRGPGEDVAAAYAALGAHQTGALEGEQDLLQVRLRKAGALGQIAHRRRSAGPLVERQREQRPTGVVASRGDPHSAPS